MKNNIPVSQDIELLSQINDGDREAFNVIFRKYYKPLCAYAYRFVTIDDAEETVQDLLLWLWQNHEKMVIQTSLSSYLFRAVYLRCISCIGQNNVKQKAEKFYWQNQVDNIPQDVTEFQTEELLKRIHESIDRLPESYRKAFVMHRFQGNSYKEIARHLNVSPKTVDYRIQQSLKLLLEDLKEYLPVLLAFALYNDFCV